MHPGKNNPKHKYMLDGIEIESSNDERDLGINISSTGNCDKHVYISGWDWECERL